MGDKPGKNDKSDSGKLQGLVRNLAFFLFLVVLPISTLYIAFSEAQKNIESDLESSSLEEMAEITAHMSRLATPETFFQDKLRRLSESFRWASSTAEVSSIGYENAIDLFLFDDKGKRLTWAGGEKGKKRISENYLQLLIELHQNPSKLFDKRSQSIAASFSGHSATIYSLVKNPETLVSFQGLGLRKLGAWFRPRLKNGKKGHLLAFIEQDKINKHHLAERAIRKIQRFAGKRFHFAWIDLKDKKFKSCTGKIKLTNAGTNLLTLQGLKSGFRFEEHLYSLTDTSEGIRLICFREIPAPPGLLETYLNIIRVIVPVVFMFLLWKSIFKVKMNLSIRLQFSLIFGYTALTGIFILLFGIMSYQTEKQNSLIAEKKEQAIKILEKIDRNFSASYGDLLRQYRRFIKLLAAEDADPAEILKPLHQAQKDENIAFASYVDSFGNFIFRAPSFAEQTGKTGLEVKYANLINSVSAQVIKTFNSTRLAGNKTSSDVIGVKTISERPIEGLLHNRSTLQKITFDGDETMTFMDLAINASDTALGCLFIVHEPGKLQLKYLSSSGATIAGSTGFQLAAFPKICSERKNYFPRFSLTNELPLWKLQDLVNQTQVSGFKIGRIDNKQVLVAATPGHNLRNYNLFLIMPLDKIKNEARQLTMMFVIATILSIIFIAFLSGMLVKSLITPISHLASCARALISRKKQKVDHLYVPEGNELESISTGLADLIIKVREFNEGRSIKRHLLPPEPLVNGKFVCDGFQIANSNEEKEIYYFTKLNENQSLVFLMRTDLEGIEGSLHLSMARMAVRLIAEELNVNSSYHILKDLEEYFRINLRRRLGGDFFLGIFDSEANQLSYSGCGNIAILLQNGQNEVFEKLTLAETCLGSSKFHDTGNIGHEFTDNSVAIVLSGSIKDVCGDKIPGLLRNQKALRVEEIKALLLTEAEKNCRQGFYDSASILVAKVFPEVQN
ncbi:MAG: hypothetical protein Kow0029_09770 [Candidatus Rifleibacteriota bacterium]